MPYKPISGSTLQFSRNASGDSASGYYLKGYASGTNTPLSMGVDSIPSSTLAKCTLNSRGEPISNDADPDSLFIPHFDESYRIALYSSADDADNNVLANAVWDIDGLSLGFDASELDVTVNGLSRASVQSYLENKEVPDYAAMIALHTSTPYQYGDVVTLTDDGIAGDFTIVHSSAHGITSTRGVLIRLDNNYYARRNYEGSINAQWFGAVPDLFGGVGTENSTPIQEAVDYANSIGGGTVYLPAGRYRVSQTINMKSYTHFIGEYGETGFGVQSDVRSGAELSWYGADNAYIIRAFNCRMFKLDGIQLQGNEVTGVKGILLDTDNLPSGSQNEFHRFNIRNCLLGVQWGTSGIAGGGYANDGTRFSTFTIWSNMPESKGFVVNSGNAGQMSTIEAGGIQTEDIGIDLIVANILQINRVFGGGVMKTAFIRASVAIGVSINASASEAWGLNRIWRTNATYFLRVVAPAESYPITETVIRLTGNQINNPVRVDSSCRIQSSGNDWGYCRDYDTGVDLAAEGYFTAGMSICASENEGVNESSFDLTTNELLHSWQYSDFVVLTLNQPGREWVSPAFDDANFTGGEGMTWTLQGGDVESYKYHIAGKMMTVDFSINQSTLILPPASSELLIRIPLGKTAASRSQSMCRIINGTTEIGFCYTTTSDQYIHIQKNDLGNFIAGVDNVGVAGQISFEIQ